MTAAGAVWPWLALIGLGAFHGLNPAMGWLFAVALGLYRQSRKLVLVSLLPIASGHALAIAAIFGLVLGAGATVDPRHLELGLGWLLIGWGLYSLAYGHRHRVRIGLRTGLFGLGLWSFLMASAHGAGLMLVPALLKLQTQGAHAHHHALPAFDSVSIAVLGLAAHMLAMLAVTGAVAILVYDWVGLAFLRRGWINLDLVWALALIAVGVFLLLS